MSSLVAAVPVRVIGGPWVATGFPHGIGGRRDRSDITASGRCRCPVVMALPRPGRDRAMTIGTVDSLIFGCRLSQGGGPDRRVHRVLPAIRTGQRGQCQNSDLVEAGHRTHGGYRERVARQHTCLVSTQDIHRRRFIHRRKASRENPPALPRPAHRAPTQG